MHYGECSFDFYMALYTKENEYKIMKFSEKRNKEFNFYFIL